MLNVEWAVTFTIQHSTFNIQHSTFPVPFPSRLPLHRRIQSAIAVIHVIAQVEDPSPIDPGRPVEDVNRQRALHANGPFTPRARRLFDARARPFGLAPEQIFRKLDRFLDPHAAVAERAHRLRKQSPCRRIVHIDGLTVRNVELDPTERVPRSGLLPVTTTGDTLHVLAREIPRIASDCRGDLTRRDAVRHIPVGAEDDALDLTAEHRRLLEILSDDDAHRKAYAAIDHLQLERGDVQHRVAITERLRQPSPPLQVDFDLPDTIFGWNLHRPQRFRSDHAIDIEPVSPLIS